MEFIEPVNSVQIYCSQQTGSTVAAGENKNKKIKKKTQKRNVDGQNALSKLHLCWQRLRTPMYIKSCHAWIQAFRDSSTPTWALFHCVVHTDLSINVWNYYYVLFCFSRLFQKSLEEQCWAETTLPIVFRI